MRFQSSNKIQFGDQSRLWGNAVIDAMRNERPLSAYSVEKLLLF